MSIDKDSRLLNVYIPIILFLVGFAWKIVYIDHRDICNDEPFTIFNAQKPAMEIIKLATENEPTPPLFMLLLHFWIKLFGIGPFSVRFLPLLFNALTVPVIYFAGKRFIGLWAGLVASGLFLFSNYHFIYGLETRTYSLVSLATAASLYFYLSYSENVKDRKALAGLIISNLVLVYSHHFGWFVIFSQVISRYYFSRDLKTHYRLAIPALATVVGFLPMVPVIVNQFISKTNRGTWLTPPHPYDYINALYNFLNHKVVFWTIIMVIGCGVVFIVITVLLKRWKGFNKNVMVLLQWWLIPYTIMYFASLKLPMFNIKYLVYNSIGIYLFIGALINFLFQKNKYFEPAIGLLVLVFMYVYMRVLPNDISYREVKNSVEYVKTVDTDNRIVIIYPAWTDFQFTYYYNREMFTDYRNYYDVLKKNGVYRVWGLPNTKLAASINPGKRVIYIQDGLLPDKDNLMFRYLDSAYVRVDSAFFPQTIQVGVYDPKAGI